MAAIFTPPLAALTTVFTPPCSTTWLLTTTKTPSQYPPFATIASAACGPPEWQQYLSQRGFFYYSPAICPTGFYIGPGCVVDNPRTGEGFPEIQAGETAAYCVPDGLACTSDTTDYRGGVWGWSAANTASVTVGPAIQIRWRSGDLDDLETDPITPGPKPTPAPSTSAEKDPPSSTRDTVTVYPHGQFPLPESTPTSPITRTTDPGSGRDLSTRTQITSLNMPLISMLPSPEISTTNGPASPEQGADDDENKGEGGGKSKSTSESKSESDSGSGSGSENGNGSPDFTVAAMVLSAVLIAIVGGYTAYIVVRRYRAYRAGGKTSEVLACRAEAWARRHLLPPLLSLSLQLLSLLFLLLSLRRRRRRHHRHHGGSGDRQKGEGGEEKTAGGYCGKGKRRRIPDAELGTDGPLTELGDNQALGTRENPAELPALERWSRFSRISKMFTGRATARHGSSTSGV